ncbi:MAG: hypothetical protein NC254_07985 [bacterium]|nr:hypothetical protein [bacterium]
MGREMQNTKKEKYAIVLIILSVVLFAGIVFMWGIHFGAGGWQGDLGVHADAAMRIDAAHIFPSYNMPISYPGWHYMFRVVYGMTKGLCAAFSVQTDCFVTAIALTETFFLTVTFLLILAYLRNADRTKQKYPILIYILIAFGLMFAGPFFIKAVNKEYYLGQLTSNPWHNPTTIAVKPCVVGVFYYYTKALRANEAGDADDGKQSRIKAQDQHLATFALLLAVSAFFKPSLYQMFVPGLFLFCVMDVLRTRFRSFWFCLKTGIALIPTGIVAVIQYRISLSASNRMYLAWGKIWGQYTEHILWSVLISVIFPLFMLIIYCKKLLKDRKIQLTVFVFLSGALQFAIINFEEDWGADFAWGAYLGTFLLFLTAAELLLDCWHKKGFHWTSIVGSILFLVHVLFGIWYFSQMYVQGTFWI